MKKYEETVFCCGRPADGSVGRCQAEAGRSVHRLHGAAVRQAAQRVGNGHPRSRGQGESGPRDRQGRGRGRRALERQAGPAAGLGQGRGLQGERRRRPHRAGRRARGRGLARLGAVEHGVFHGQPPQVRQAAQGRPRPFAPRVRAGRQPHDTPAVCQERPQGRHAAHCRLAAHKPRVAQAILGGGLFLCQGTARQSRGARGGGVVVVGRHPHRDVDARRGIPREPAVRPRDGRQPPQGQRPGSGMALPQDD